MIKLILRVDLSSKNDISADVKAPFRETHVHQLVRQIHVLNLNVNILSKYLCSNILTDLSIECFREFAAVFEKRNAPGYFKQSSLNSALQLWIISVYNCDWRDIRAFLTLL